MVRYRVSLKNISSPFDENSEEQNRKKSMKMAITVISTDGNYFWVIRPAEHFLSQLFSTYN